VAEFFEARVRAESQDWTFGAHQAAARAAEAEELVALRRHYEELSEAELAGLAGSWRSDSASGPYFVFAAAELGDEYGQDCAAVAAAFVKALRRELDGGAPAALGELLGQWDEQRRYAWGSGQRLIPARPPRVALRLPRDPRRWPAESWDGLERLDLDAAGFDGTLLRWEPDSGAWLADPLR
jgi:hypothetical protein